MLGLLQFGFENIARENSRPALGECDADGASEPVRGAGDDGGFACEVSCHVRSRLGGVSWMGTFEGDRFSKF